MTAIFFALSCSLLRNFGLSLSRNRQKRGNAAKLKPVLLLYYVSSVYSRLCFEKMDVVVRCSFSSVVKWNIRLLSKPGPSPFSSKFNLLPVPGVPMRVFNYFHTMHEAFSKDKPGKIIICHLTLVTYSTLPDMTQKLKIYVVFLSTV